MMIIDNSEYMRNGDYHPSRFDAQADAVNAVFNTKIDSNPENSVGIMTMAGKGWAILVLPLSSNSSAFKPRSSCHEHQRPWPNLASHSYDKRQDRRRCRYSNSYRSRAACAQAPSEQALEATNSRIRWITSSGSWRGEVKHGQAREETEKEQCRC